MSTTYLPEEIEWPDGVLRDNMHDHRQVAMYIDDKGGQWTEVKADAKRDGYEQQGLSVIPIRTYHCSTVVRSRMQRLFGSGKQEGAFNLPPNYKKQVVRTGDQSEAVIVTQTSSGDEVDMQKARELFPKASVREIVPGKVYLVEGIDSAALASRANEYKIEQTNGKLPYKMHASMGMQFPGGEEEAKSYLEGTLGLHDKWLALCKLGGVTGRRSPIDIEYTPARQHVERTICDVDVNYDESAMRHRIVSAAAKPFHKMGLDVRTYLQEGVEGLPMYERILAHEEGHMIAPNIPYDGFLSEALAELLTWRLKVKQGRTDWPEVYGNGKHRLLFGNDKGFSLGTGARTDRMPIYHRAVGWVGAAALWKALGESEENLQTLIQLSQEKESSQLPTMQSWLDELDKKMRGFKKRFEDQKEFQLAEDGKRVFWFEGEGPWGQISGMDIKRNANFRYAKKKLSPHTSSVEVIEMADFDEDPGSVEPIEVKVRIQTRSGAHMIIGNTNGVVEINPKALLLYAQKAGRPDFVRQPLRISVQDPDGEEWKDLGYDFNVAQSMESEAVA